MDERGYRSDGELPFEPKPDVDKDGDRRVEHRLRAGPQQIPADLRAHDLDAAVVDVIAEVLGERGLDPLDRSELPGLAARLALDPDQHVLGAAELLERDLAEAQALQGRAHRRQIGGTRHADLDQDAALKIDTVVQTLGRQ